MIKTTQARYPDLCAASLDRGFHSPANRIRLDDLLDDIILPRKGYLNKAERDCEQGRNLCCYAPSAPAVKSAINNLEHSGRDRVRAKGSEGFAGTVSLSVVSLNVHCLGHLLRQQVRE